MSVIDNIKSFFRRGGAEVGAIKSLTNITDDDRISVPAKEYQRISEAKKYYANTFPMVTYRNSYGDKKERPLSSLNITKTAARRLASIIFNEQCSVTVNKDAQAHELIDQVFQDNDFFNTYEEQLEAGIALGGFAIRPYVENDKIKLSWIKADQFYPLKSNTTEVNEAAIADRTTVTTGKKTLYYTLLEFHEWIPQSDGSYLYRIGNELYESQDASIVGVNVPLYRLDKYKNLKPQVFLSGLETPLFAYFRTPGANNISPESPLGLGIVDNSKNTVDAINTTHDQFVHEVKIGKRRIAVPSEMLRPGGQFDGANDQMHPPVFDSETDIYERMYGDPNSLKITDLTQPIRNVQYQATMSFFMREFENQVGLSQGTFTRNDDGSMKTATEVVSNDSTTYQTRSSYLTQVEKQLNALVRAILYTAKNGALFSNGQPIWNGDVDTIETVIDFNDGVFVDQEAQFNKDQQAMDEGVMPKIQFLVRNYGLDETTAQQWLDQVDEETPEPPAMSESSLFGGGEEDGDDAEEDESGSESNS